MISQAGHICFPKLINHFLLPLHKGLLLLILAFSNVIIVNSGYSVFHSLNIMSSMNRDHPRNIDRRAFSNKLLKKNCPKKFFRLNKPMPLSALQAKLRKWTETIVAAISKSDPAFDLHTDIIFGGNGGTKINKFLDCVKSIVIGRNPRINTL